MAPQFIPIKLTSKQDWTLELYQIYAKDRGDLTIHTSTNILFWYNVHKTQGLRLTPLGFDLMRNANYQFYEHRIDTKKYPINGKELVLMDRYHPYPWFHSPNKSLFLTDGELSTLLSLCENNLLQAIQVIG